MGHGLEVGSNCQWGGMSLSSDKKLGHAYLDALSLLPNRGFGGIGGVFRRDCWGVVVVFFDPGCLLWIFWVRGDVIVCASG